MNLYRVLRTRVNGLGGVECLPHEAKRLYSSEAIRPQGQHVPLDDCSNSEPLEGTGWRQTFYGNQEERDEGKLITDPKGVGSGVNR